MSVLVNDDFFEYYSKRDLSAVKRFNFKEIKEGKTTPNKEKLSPFFAPSKKTETPQGSSKIEKPLLNSTENPSNKATEQPQKSSNNNALDILYKSINNNNNQKLGPKTESLEPQRGHVTRKSVEKSPSLLSNTKKFSGSSKQDISKYFQKNSTTVNPKSPNKSKTVSSPLRKLLLEGKESPCSNRPEVFTLRKRKFNLNKTNNVEEIIDPKENHHIQNRESSNSSYSNNPIKSPEIASNRKFQFKKAISPDKKSSREEKKVDKSLEISDSDYMDDAEFERRFGNLNNEENDQTIIINNKETDEKIEENSCSSRVEIIENDEKDLLKDIADLNWEDHEFEEEEIQKVEEEPIQTGFNDRHDDSEEFKGNYAHSETLLESLHEKFGLRTFRPHQREIINASLTGYDCFVLMPTGGGKSLCYQLPAILMPGVTVVISPLRALICDQVDKLNALDIAAAHLCADVSKDDSNSVYHKLSMLEPGLKLLYLTPEKITASTAIINTLNGLYHRGKLARFVIDEVHCLSQWGHDFRPDYKKMNILRQNYPRVPIICLTATATKQVENDVVNILKLKNVKKFIRSFNRPNIKYEVIEKKGKATNDIANLIKSKFTKLSGIVYCLSRNDCDKMAEDFAKLNIKAKPYHAGMNDKVREVIQREWMQDRFHVIVATIAFGMGIDKPDVRFVIHSSIPKSVEAFYQESGRAGRDGEISYSYLFYHYGDVTRLQKLMQLDRSMVKKTLAAHNENLKQMVSFAENVVDCRRYLQLLHLGEKFDRRICIKNKSTTCDNCLNMDKYKTIDVTEHAKNLCTIIKDISGRGNVTLLHTVEVYKGSKNKKVRYRQDDKHKFYGQGASMDRTDIQRILKDLLLKNVLKEVCTYTGEFPVVYIGTGPQFYQFYNNSITKLTISVHKDGRKFDQCVPKDFTSTNNNASKEIIPHSIQKQNNAKLQAARKLQLSQLKIRCHEELLEECRTLARGKNLTLSAIMDLTAIKIMSDLLPRSKEEMLTIQHVTVANYKKYGDAFLKITQKYREEHDAIQPLSVLEAETPTPVIIDDDFEESDEEKHFKAPNNRFSAVSSNHGVKRKKPWFRKTAGYNNKRTKMTKMTKTPVKSGWKSKNSAAGGSKLGLMPIHIK